MKGKSPVVEKKVELTIEERKQILREEIFKLSKLGYILVQQDDVSAQLVLRKGFSCFLAAFLFVFFIVPFFVYVIYYAAKKDRYAYVTVDKYGQVRKTFS